MSHERPFAFVWFDRTGLSPDPTGGRRLRIDARCLGGEPVDGAFAHVCALPEKDAALRYDEPEVQQVRRDALAWWIPMLGEELVCTSTFALDASRCAGAVTVATDPSRFDQDPFARLFPGTTVRVDFFSRVAPPAGPVIERYAGVPWPAGSFTDGPNAPTPAPRRGSPPRAAGPARSTASPRGRARPGSP
jgi:hypothetical protein